VHLLILKEKALLYKTKDQLSNIFKNIKTIINTRKDWNAYESYTPEKVMLQFKKYMLI